MVGDDLLNWRRRLDPRLHLAAAIGWAVFAVVTLAALVAANMAASEAESRVRADTERLLTQFSTQIRHALVTNLEMRRSIVQVTAAQMVTSGDHDQQALHRHLRAVQAQFPELVWLGVADGHGRVTTATGGIPEQADVSESIWFQQGRTRPFLGLVHSTRPADGVAARAVPDQPAQFIALATPLVRKTGPDPEVLAANVSWSWIEQLLTELLQELDTRRQLELLLVADDRTVLVGPRLWLARTLPPAVDLSEGGEYLVGRYTERRSDDSPSAWTVIVRQDAVSALAPARATRRTVFLSVLLAGLVSAAAAVWATRMLLRRLNLLARQAVGVQQGLRRALTAPSGNDEISRIGATLAEVVEHLQQEKQALKTLNAELDARVIERTARIERLADDARHAAVTRVRLRLARDLHDTLAHSLMALLTQIRLVRKLRSRWSESELEEELARAEDVAAGGLTEARAAITQMRHNDVRDIGLGPALQELLARFGERSGVAGTLEADADADAAELADERAETVFRIAEEALRNVERHAQARSVTLRLEAVPTAMKNSAQPGPSGRVRLEIADDGVGFDPELPRPGHYGLRGIQEQAALINGRMMLNSQPGQGTRLVLEFDA
jgi:signal transduction histidine kinase